MKKFSVVGAVLVAVLVVFGLMNFEINPVNNANADNVSAYKVVTGISISSVERSVNVEIKNGWKPTGGLVWGDEWTKFSQAMVKE